MQRNGRISGLDGSVRRALLVLILGMSQSACSSGVEVGSTRTITAVAPDDQVAPSSIVSGESEPGAATPVTRGGERPSPSPAVPPTNQAPMLAYESSANVSGFSGSGTPAEPYAFTIDEATVNGSLTLVATDVELDATAIDCGILPSWITLEGSVLSFSPGYSHSGTTTFACKANDSSLDSNVLDFQITVNDIATVTFTAPNVGSYLDPDRLSEFVVSGACSEDGRPVTISGAASVSATCTGNVWSATLDMTSASDGPFVLTADHAPAVGIAAPQASRSFGKDTVAPVFTKAVEAPDLSPSLTGLGHISYAASDVTSLVARYDYAIGTTSGAQDVLAWTSNGSATTLSISGLTLISADTYHLSVRAIDAAGNVSSVSTKSWKVQGSPFEGLSLPDTTTLSDVSYTAGSTLVNTRRTTPAQGRIVTVSGTLSADASGSTALFLRADSLVLSDQALIHADGASATGKDGGKGGAGGAGGYICCGTVVAGSGGSSGGNGTSAYGVGGAGTAASYVTGYVDYGFGGNGDDSTGAYGGASTGGSGSLGAGGGGGSSVNIGGGGGGGLVVLVANSVTGSGVVRARGGAGAGSGGGGVVWAAFRSYQGNFVADVSSPAPNSNSGPGTGGASGTARIFQLFADGSLIERGFGDSWSDGGVATSMASLPFSLAPLASLPMTQSRAIVIDTTTNSSVDLPLSVVDLEIGAVLSPATNGPTAVFLRAETLSLASGAVIAANGAVTTDRNGARGGSGGGSGALCCGVQPVGYGGSFGGNGLLTGAGAGGPGTARSYLHGGFEFGNGGHGGTPSAAPAGAGGSGGNGAGGGGGGATSRGGCGGGGLVVIVADAITGSGIVRANGGSCTTAGGGGGGVIWVAAKTYAAGAITAEVEAGAGGTGATAGTARIFKINSDGTLTPKTFAEGW